MAVTERRMEASLSCTRAVHCTYAGYTWTHRDTQTDGQVDFRAVDFATPRTQHGVKPLVTGATQAQTVLHLLYTRFSSATAP